LSISCFAEPHQTFYNNLVAVFVKSNHLSYLADFLSFISACLQHQWNKCAFRVRAGALLIIQEPDIKKTVPAPNILLRCYCY